MIHLAFHNGRAEILPRIHIGGAPYPWDGGHGFDVVVLCADEYQVDLDRYGLATVIRCPFKDSVDPMSQDTVDMVSRTAEEVHRLWEAGKSVAVTCMAGRNRSGLVLAKVLGAHGIPPIRAIELIRKFRPSALTNKVFNDWLIHGET